MLGELPQRAIGWSDHGARDAAVVAAAAALRPEVAAADAEIASALPNLSNFNSAKLSFV